MSTPPQALWRLSADDEWSVDRRGFLRLAAVTAGGVALAEWVARWRPAPLTTAPETLHLAGGAALVPGDARAVSLGDTAEALVVRLDVHSYVAVDRRCPHLGCPVLWSRSAERFECPCHDAAFDARTGRVLYGPPPRGLERLAVEVDGADLWLRRDGKEGD